MPRVSRTIILAGCSLIASLFCGCVGSGRSTRGPIGDLALDDSTRTAVGTPDAEEPTADSQRPPASLRSFPQQGWWCGEYENWLAPERAERGYTIILPGVEGTSWFNVSIARGLVDAGHDGAIEIDDWTTGYWPMFVYHLMALERNKAEAQKIAGKIVAYQDRYPNRPVRLIGHSGGAALAVLVLEALPEDRKITQAVLLAGALSPDYNLSTALGRTERGVTTFYSPGDVLYLMAGTLALGTIDRQHTASAGAVGFRLPDHLTTDARQLYETLLHQEPYRWEMARSRNFGGHIGPANRKFVADWVAPLFDNRR
jgi:pimeloyl-ACP methyl ester carboxylesterase